MSSAARNRQLVERLWAAVYARDFATVEAMCHPDGEYTDVFSPGGADDVAHGPRQMVGRLRLGLEPLAAIYHHPRHLIAEGDVVMWEHAEEWHWPSGESVTIKFVTVHEIRDGLIYRWHDYPDLQKLLAAAPQWWMEHIMQGYARD